MSLSRKLLASFAATPTGEEVFTGLGNWVAPDNVFSVSVACLGSGGSGGSFDGVPYNGGGGGGLGWRNNISVTPGQSYVVGDDSGRYFITPSTVKGERGGNGAVNTVGIGGSFVGDGGFSGGNGGVDSGGTSNRIPGSGGDAANWDSDGDNAGPAGEGLGDGTNISSNNDGPYGAGGAGGGGGTGGFVQIRWGEGKDFP